jgi:Family of unknown function (DUF5947)
MTNAVLAKLRALVTGASVEECQLCAQVLTGEHEHLLEVEARRLHCACLSCARALGHDPCPRAARYLRVQRRAARLSGVLIDDARWAELRVPVGLAFFTTRSRTGEVIATFPGRSGIIESFVPLKAWSALEQQFPVLKGVQPDVEALLVRRTSRHHDYFQVSADLCFELAELLRGVASTASSGELRVVQRFFERLEPAP